MLATAVLRYAKFSAQKARLVADQVRGLSVPRAVELLTYSPKRAARSIQEVLASAVANAKDRFGVEPSGLRLSTIMVDDGPQLKRMFPRAKGRGDRRVRRMCHISVRVTDAARGEK